MPDWSVRVPASSANLGPGFDALAVALAAHLVVEPAAGAGAHDSDPAVRAFRAAGGRGGLDVRATFPGGRGLGYSGAARVAGVLAALRQAGRIGVDARVEALAHATRLEGHADNVAASLVGGVVAVAGGRAVRVPLAIAPAVVVWVPARETSTSASRSRLPETVPFADAAFNIGRTAVLVAALASGDVGALRDATADRLHQAARLAAAPESRRAIDDALAAGAWCAWLSGSGPSVAAFVDPPSAHAVATALPDGGRAMVLQIDDEGAVVT
ncbi:MAG TPA: homoserine kinase [Acidimicrobiia bacterium]|nr:homoserine kinase [Acidimicrobiia bacterium]